VRCALRELPSTEDRRGWGHLALEVDDSTLRSAVVRPTQLLLVGAPGERVCRVCKHAKQLNEFPFRSVEQQTRQWICLESAGLQQGLVRA